MKKLLFAVLAVLIASPAFAAIQNVKVSGDINSWYIDRQNFGLGALNNSVNEAYGEGDVGTPAGVKSQNIIVTQTRLRVDADLSDNVSATVRLINERAWGQAANSGAGDGVNLDLAYVTLREFLYSPLTLTVGRQEIVMGNGFIIGGGPNEYTTGQLAGIANDLSSIDSVDGVKAVLDYKPLTITSFYYKDGQTTGSLRGLYNNKNSNDDVYGINGNYQLGDAMNTVVEGYLFARFMGKTYANEGQVTGSVPYLTYHPADKNDSLYVPGLRASTNPIKGLNVQGELAWQLGQTSVTNGANQESERRGAMGAQLSASYALPVLEKYKPTVNAGFTYVSGDKNGGANYNTSAVKSAKAYGAWDQFDKAQNGGTIYNAIFPLTNMYIYSLGASAAPLEDVTTSFTWSNLQAVDSYNTYNTLYLIQPNSNVVYPVGTPGKNEKGLGNEYDVNVNYAYTEDVSFGVSLGWFAPGAVFSSENNLKPASQALANVAVKF